MPLSLQNVSTLDLSLLSALALLSLVCIGLVLRLQEVPKEEDVKHKEMTSGDGEPSLLQINTELNAKFVKVKSELQEAEAKTKESQEETELLLLQLQQMQEELEQIFLADQSKMEQINELEKRIKSAPKRKYVQSLESKLMESQKEVEVLLLQMHQSQDVAESNSGSEELELCMLQLKQLQEELQFYFNLSRELKSLIENHENQQIRVKKILSWTLRNSTK